MKAMPFSSCVSRSVGRRTEAISPQSWNTSVRAWRTSSSPWYLSKPLTKIVVGSEPDESACNQKSSAPYWSMKGMKQRSRYPIRLPKASIGTMTALKRAQGRCTGAGAEHAHLFGFHAHHQVWRRSVAFPEQSQ